MPELLHAPIRAVGGDPETLLPMVRLDPAYPGVLPNGSELLIRADHDAMREEIRPGLRSDGRRGVRRVLRLAAASSTSWSCRTSSTATSTPPSTWCPAATAARLLRLGGFRQLGPARRALLQRRAPAPDLQLPGDVRRAGACQALAIYAVITYMDSVRRRVLPRGGMHACPVALARRPSRPAPGSVRDGGERILLAEGRAGSRGRTRRG